MQASKKATFALAAFTAAAALAGKASALELGQCYPKASVSSLLQAEGQHSIVQAIGEEQDPAHPDDASAVFYKGRFFTTNEEGTTGYILNADIPVKPEEIKAENPVSFSFNELCVDTITTNVKLFDPQRSGVHPDVQFRGSKNPALKECGDDRLCTWDRAIIFLQAKKNDNVIMQADVVAQKDRSYPEGSLLTLTARILGDGKGSLAYTTQSGAHTFVKGYAGVLLRQWALDRFKDEIASTAAAPTPG